MVIIHYYSLFSVIGNGRLPMKEKKKETNVLMQTLKENIEGRADR